MSKNFDSISDEDGDAPDWIEIYNPTDNDIDLGGYFLSDDANNLSMWEFPSGLVFPDDHLLVFVVILTILDGSDPTIPCGD